MVYNRLFHNYLFLFGAIFYLILPICVVSNNWGTDYPGFSNVYTYYIPSIFSKYLLIIIAFVVAFYIGSFLPLKLTKPTIKYKSYPCVGGDNRNFVYILFPFWLYGQLVILKNRNKLFSGYMLEYDVVFLGTIATLNVLFLFFFLYLKLSGNKKSYYLLFALIEFSIVLIGMGSRMYIMIPTVAIIIYILDNSVIPLKKVCIWSGILICLALFIGAFRLGKENISFDFLLYIGLAESVLTWISCVSLFALNEFPLFAYPQHFISSFLNFVPTALFPDKGSYILPLSPKFEAPLGATSVIVSVISDFGIMGGCIMFFILGFLLTYIRINYKGLFGKTYYYCCCGIIPFQLFRDGFTIVNKMFVFNLFILPIVLIFMKNILRKSSKMPAQISTREKLKM